MPNEDNSPSASVPAPVDASPIWASSIDATLGHFSTTLEGLSDTEAKKRRDRDGPNRLAEKKPRASWKKFLDQFKDLLVIILICTAVLAGAVGDITDTVVILCVVLFNASLGFYQEHRAEETLAALKNMLALDARARRDGAIQKVSAADLVVGDIVLLDAGDRIPADARVIVAHNVEVAEAALTGESHPVAKRIEVLDRVDLPVAERTNMVFMNTVVTRGRLEVVVSGTGMRTEMGRIAGLLDVADERPTPLQLQLDGLGKHLAIIAGVVVTLVFVLGVLRGDPVVQSIMISIALAVAAIPEGLPAVVTVTLAIGMRRMAKNRAIVKRLAAVETLGSTSVICSDKTGTLTLNEMTARELFFAGRTFVVSGEGYSGEGEIKSSDPQAVPDLMPLLMPSALCNESTIRDGKLIGDPTEGALLAVARKGGVKLDQLDEDAPRIAEIPFDAEHKFMATFHRRGDEPSVTMLVKGAPDVLFTRSDHQVTEGGEVALDDNARTVFQRENDRLAERAMRVLAVARRVIPFSEFDPAADLMTWTNHLSLVGLIGLIDPPRPEARDAIRLCKKAGIQVKMITGDQSVTASAIAIDLGLEGAMLTGADLDKLKDDELSNQIEHTAVFARVAPEHKVKIVRALKARGHVVAMTGDGVNDAPALKHADIGIAMGLSGTEVAKEAAAMILTDDNFVTIVGAVKEGRTIYDNIVKFVRFQLSTNIGAILAVLGAHLLGLPAPFTAIQILWINIIMDGPPAMTLGLEPARPSIMGEPPRSSTARILTFSRFVKLLAFGALMAVGTLGMFQLGLESRALHTFEGDATQRAMLQQTHATTLAFTTFVLFQIFNAFNARAENTTAFDQQFFSNRKLWLALTGVVAFQVIVVQLNAAQRVFHTSPLTLREWAQCTLVASSVLLFEEVRKLFASLIWPTIPPVADARADTVVLGERR